MSMSDPGQRMPEEQDYVQAYENVREKYKGNNTTVFSSLYCTIWELRLGACLNGRWVCEWVHAEVNIL